MTFPHNFARGSLNISFFMEEGIVCKKRKLAGIAGCSPICNAIWGIMRYENIRLTARFQNGPGVSFAHIAATAVKMCRRYVISQSRKIACHSRHGGFHEAQSCRLAHQRALAPRLGRFRERLKKGRQFLKAITWLPPVRGAHCKHLPHL